MAATALAFTAGLFNIGFAIFHMGFWRMFGWPARLATLDRVNRSLVPVINLALTAMFLVAGAALAAEPRQATETAIGRWLLGGLCLFWLARLLVQKPYFGLRHPISLTLTVIFFVGFLLHGGAFVLGWRGG